MHLTIRQATYTRDVRVRRIRSWDARISALTESSARQFAAPALQKISFGLYKQIWTHLARLMAMHAKTMDRNVRFRGSGAGEGNPIEAIAFRVACSLRTSAHPRPYRREHSL